MSFSPYIIPVLALLGFNIAMYVHIKKAQKKPLICPMTGGCDSVVLSKYGSLFGIPVENLGFIYYGFILTAYLLTLLVPSLSGGLVQYVVAVASSIAFLFSLYLTSVQIFALRHLCTWCISSALISTCIFVLSILSISSLSVLANDFASLSLILHLVALGVGFGAAMISDFLFMRFFSDNAINDHEAETLDVLSSLVWLGLTLFIVSGLGLFLQDSAGYLANGKFVAKMVIIGVIAVNGLLMHWIVKPHLQQIGKTITETKKTRRLRALSFILGGISVSSWFSALVLGALHISGYGAGLILSYYAVVVLLAIAASLSLMLYKFRR